MMIESALLPTYTPADIVFKTGRGAWLYDQDGQSYLDFGSGIAVNTLGYSHPHLVSELIKQAQNVWHLSNLVRIEGGERLAARLVAVTFAEKVFFTNSGAEANECALKIARKAHAFDGHPERYRILTFEGAFHGRTLATIAAGGQRKYIDGFGPKVDGFDQVSIDDTDAIAAWIGPHSAGLMIEPIMGEGGVRVIEAHRLRYLRDLADRHNLALIFDEVQTGVGRTGRFCNYESSGVAPDIMSLAKGIGGGFPLGACLATKHAARGMTAGTHASTFGGNPLAMACGNAVLDVVLSSNFLEDVRRKADVLTAGLIELQGHYPDVIAEIRGTGFLIGIKLHTSNIAFAEAARQRKLLLVPAGDNVVRVLPPLVVTDDDIGVALERIAAVVKQTRPVQI